MCPAEPHGDRTEVHEGSCDNNVRSPAHYRLPSPLVHPSYETDDRDKDSENADVGDDSGNDLDLRNNGDDAGAELGDLSAALSAAPADGLVPLFYDLEPCIGSVTELTAVHHPLHL